MALVSYGSCSDDSDYSEDENTSEGVVLVKSDPGKVNNVSDNGEKEENNLNGHISDEEDFLNDNPDPNSSLFEEPSEPSIFSLISKKLPQAKVKTKAKEKSTLVDEQEDLTSIPVKKDYGDKVEEPPAKKKKKSDGPVKISIPSLAELKDDEDPDEFKVKAKSQPSKKGSGLIGLLPKPKNFMAKKAPRPSGPTPMTNTEVLKRDGSISFNNLKPQAVRKVGLIPHKVANPPKKIAKPAAPSTNSDSDSDDDLLGVAGSSNSYFPSHSQHEPKLDSTNAYVNPTPMPTHPGLLPPTLPADPSFVSFDVATDIASTGINYSDLGPAVAPYPPPMPTDLSANQGGSLVDNEEAIQRLAGKQNKMKEFKDDQAQFIEVKEDDMRGDPLVWMTKAMTEEKAPRPTGKGPKGLAKSRHQITYLAHQAKERDWELKQEWAQARENRRASANKYGFM